MRAPATVRWFSKGGADLSATEQVLTLPTSFGDHLTFDPVTGELLASWRDNGSAGAVGRFGRSSYGGWTLVGVDTLAGADAIEGAVTADGSSYVVNGDATLPGMPIANRILRQVPLSHRFVTQQRSSKR